jgi:cytochrome c oxidase subunit I
LVHARDELWHRKYSEDQSGRPVPVVAGGAVDEHEAEEEHPDPHMPDPSFFPLLAAAGLPLLGYGAMYHWSLAVLGGLLIAGGLFGWSLEPVAEEEH